MIQKLFTIICCACLIGFTGCTLSETTIDENTTHYEDTYQTSFSDNIDFTQTNPELPADDEIEKQLSLSYDIFAETSSLDDFDKNLNTLLKNCNGFIEFCETDGNPSYNETLSRERTSVYILRIPSENCAIAVDKLKTVGNITKLKKQAVNLDSQFSNYETKLKSLQTQETHLLKTLSTIQNADDIIKLEQHLATILEQIDKTKQAVINLQMAKTYSIIHLNVTEIKNAIDRTNVSFDEKLSAELHNIKKTFCSFTETAVLSAIRIMPTLLLLGCIVCGYLLFRRKFKKTEKVDIKSEKSKEKKE